MVFIICDDHSESVEADDFDMAQAKELMLAGEKADATAAEKEVIEFGKEHRNCNIRVMPG